MRDYSVEEIDALRRVCSDRVEFGTSFNDGRGRVGRQFSVGEVERITEDHVRTHMMAGHTAEDILYVDAQRASQRASSNG